MGDADPQSSRGPSTRADDDTGGPTCPHPPSVSGSSARSATATASGSLAGDAGAWPIADGAADDEESGADNRGRSGPPPCQPLACGLSSFLDGIDRLRADLARDPVQRGDEERPTASAWRSWNEAAIHLEDGGTSHVRRAIESRVIPFRGGIYRGQVIQVTLDGGTPSAQDGDPRPSAADDADPNWVPCGYGVWTKSEDGSSILGRWAPKATSVVQCCGHLQRPGLSFEGEWVDSFEGAEEDPTAFSGVGVGAFAFGGVFTGAWAASAPCGLGELVLFTPQATNDQNIYSRGWIQGIQCVQACASTVASADTDADAPTRLVRDVRRDFPDQPDRGLVVAALKLERWRARALTRAMTQWRRCFCHQSVRTARLARLDAIRARSLALEAEARAIQRQLELQLQDERCVRVDVHALVLQSRAASEKRRRTRERYVERRREAEAQLEFARSCFQHQREAVEMMERELNATLELLVVVRQAQTDCHTAVHELLALKRQIENMSVQINALRQRIQERHAAKIQHLNYESALNAGGDGAALALGLPSSRLATAASTTFRIKSTCTVLSRVDVLSVEGVDAGASVCDVPGCGCGIPRDVFLRVASALNGE